MQKIIYYCAAASAMAISCNRCMALDNTGEQGMDKDKEAELEARLEELPRGYISRKMIAGKERLYLQWREGGKVRSRYIKDSEKDQVIAAVAERKELEAELKNKPAYYLKWGDSVVGEIDQDLNVRFLKSANEFNAVLNKYVPDSGFWSREDFVDFLRERIVSPGRRDIEEILFKCGLTTYDAVAIGLKTCAISARDMLWIADKAEDDFNDAVTEVFRSVFVGVKDLAGESVDTPEGQNVKRYGVSQGKYGIYKQRLTPLSADVESEIAVYKLAERIGVPCCPCWRIDEDTVFSEFVYDFSREYIVHMRQLIRSRAYDDDFRNLLSARPEYLDFFVRMIALDFITRQDDRHLSNIAIKISSAGESIYPLYDNGRSLFYEDTEETAVKACDDVQKFCTSFGPAGTYLDHIQEIAGMGISFNKLLDLSIEEQEVRSILEGAGFAGYRLDGACKWILRCIGILKELG